MRGDRREHREVVRARPQAGDRLVHRQHPEQLAVGVAQRKQQHVLGLPGVAMVAGLEPRDERRLVVARPVDRAGGQEIGAGHVEAGVEKRRPGIPVRRRAEQGLRRVVASVDGDNLELVVGRAAQVDDHGAERKRLGDRLGHRGAQLLTLDAGADEPGHVKQPGQAFDQSAVSLAHLFPQAEHRPGAEVRAQVACRAQMN
jgi:hypothetical protein